MITSGIKKKVWRVIDLINWADEYFSLKGFDDPRKEIEWMLTCLLYTSDAADE